jgi:hypothetical protein
MTTLEGTLSNARARVSSLRFWCDHIVSNYDVYASDHAACPGFVNVHGNVAAVRDDVRAFATTIQNRVDASGWVSEIGDRVTPWNRAASHVSDASAAVQETSLRAVTTWRKGASPRYREAVPPQRSAMSSVLGACQGLKTACTDTETAGTTHFESVESLAATLVSALTYHFTTTSLLAPPSYGSPSPLLPQNGPVYGPESPIQEHRPVTTPCPAGTLHVSTFDISNRFGNPLSTAQTALTTADDALRSAVHRAFTDPAPRRPGPLEEYDVPITSGLGAWPVPGQAPGA